MNPRQKTRVRGVLAIACISLLSFGNVAAQTSPAESDASPETGKSPASEKMDASLEEAFNNLSNRKFGIRQAATQRLANAGIAILSELENRALINDVDFQSHCIDIITLIGREDAHREQAIEAMQRLSDNREFTSAGKAAQELFLLKESNIDRAVRLLTASGARVNRIGAGGPVYSISSVTTDEQCKQLQYFSKLSSLSLSGNGITDACVSHLSKATSLQSLNLSNSAISPRGMAAMKSIQNLNRLTLSGRIPPGCIQELSKLKQISSLQLATAVDEDALRTIASMPLKNLLISQLRVSPKTAEIMRNIKAAQLTLHLNSIKDDDLRWLIGCKTNSIGLSITNSKELTDKGIRSLENTNITSLTLYKTGITAKAMKSIGSLSQLLTLTIKDSPIDDDSLMRLSELKVLRQLSLTGTKVTSEGMAAIKGKLTTLRYTIPAAPSPQSKEKEPEAPKKIAPKPPANG
ncbi:hypothetical protein OAG60_02485 [bacterium]|nr:hypothetical protein [bacterium]